MLDIAGILFSSLIMLYVLVQAVRLDATRPWFEGPAKTPDIPATVQHSQTGQAIVQAIVPWRERRH